MKRNLFFALCCMLFAAQAFSQVSTEQFESESGGSTSFTENGVIFKIISHTGYFDIQADYPGTGWNGTGIDNRYIDNSGNVAPSASFSIKTTSNLFKAYRFWIFLSGNNPSEQNVSGTLNVTGKLSGVTKFTQTKTTGFATSLGSTNGYTLIDMTNLNGQNYSNIVIDELRLTLGGAYTYAGFDAFTWFKDPGMVLPVTFGSVEASISNSRLQVTWETETELNNDHFDIEGSGDGQTFTKIATVKSKSGGNSNTKTEYEWTSASNMYLAIPMVSIILMLLVFLKRKKIVLAGCSILSFLAIVNFSCSKQNDGITPNGSYYIRIAQIDKDGLKKYSQVVKAVHK